MNIESPVKGEAVSFELGEDYPELRDAVRRICAKYPGAYWRDLEDRSLRLHGYQSLAFATLARTPSVRCPSRGIGLVDNRQDLDHREGGRHQ